MPQTGIDAIRALLGLKPRPVGWEERRRRLDEVGAVWRVAEDVKLEAVDLDGIPCEWSSVPGADSSRVLMFFHGGGYCSGSIVSHRRMAPDPGAADPLAPSSCPRHRRRTRPARRQTQLRKQAS